MAILTAPTLTELLVDVRLLLNQPDAANSTWGDDELTRYVNEGVRRYFTEVVQNSEGQFVTQTDLDITADQDTVTLPSDFFEIRALFKKVSNGYVMLSYDNNLTKGYSTQGGTGGNTYFPSYQLRGNTLVLRDVPNYSETSGLRLEYVAFPTTMVDGGDSLTSGVAPLFKDLIVTYAAYKAKLKESAIDGSRTYEAYQQNLQSLFMAFKEAISMRSHNPTYVEAYNPETE